jgi:hypothetical protein
MAMLSWLSPVFGKKTHIPAFDFLNLSDEQRKAIEGNIANMPRIEELGNLFQQFYLDQMDTAFGGTGVFRKIMETGGKTTQKMLDVAGTWLSGEMDPEDVKKVWQSSAGQSLLSSGTASPQFTMSNALANYGRGIMQTKQMGAQMAGQGENAAQMWARLSGAGAMQNMLITPSQQADLDLKQSIIKFNRKMMVETERAKRDPVIGGLSDIVETLTAAYVGSLGGGMGGSKGNINNAPKSATTSLDPAFETATPENAVDWNNSGFSFDASSATAGLSKDGGYAAPADINNSFDLPTADVNQASNTGYPWTAGGPIGTTALSAALMAMKNQSVFNQSPNNQPVDQYPYQW